VHSNDLHIIQICMFGRSEQYSQLAGQCSTANDVKNIFWNIALDTSESENPSSGSRVVPCGQKDGRTMDIHDEANSRLSLLV
jgi:hypothetical protein